MLKNKFFLFLLFVLSLPTFIGLVRPGYFPMHDDMQAMRLLQMDKCVKDFQIPCRWVPDMGYGYGYPQFNFYSPLPYYTMEGFHLLGFGILDSVKIGFIITIFISGLGMYLLGERLWGRWGGLLSSLLYIYAPYRAVDMYVRGAVGEFWALSILPFVFWSILKIRSKEKYSHLFLALSLASLFLSHNVTTIISLPFFAAFVFVLSAKDYLENKDSGKIFNFWVSGIFSSLWGFGIAAFFMLPVYFEKQYAHVETLVGGYFDYRIHFVGIKQLMFSNFFGFGGSDATNFDEVFLSVGSLYWIIALVGLVSLVYFRKNKQLLFSAMFVLFGFLSLFMIHSRSTPIWSFISFLEIIQFPWRFLVISTFSFSVAAGAIMTTTKNKAVLFTSIFIIISLFYASFFRPKYWIDINEKEKFAGENWRLQQTISIFDYLPKSAKFPPANKAPDNPQVLEGKALVTSLEKRTASLKFDISVSENSTIQIPLFYFPGWQIYVNGEVYEFRYDNDLGLMTLDLDEGKYEILANFENTPVRTVGNMISLISIIGIGVYYLKHKRK